MKTLPQPDAQDILLSAVFYALSDPLRLHIARRLLAETELTCGEFDLSVPKSTLSYHFKTLRKSGVTSTRVEGTQHWISLRKDDLERRFPGLLAMIREKTD